MNRRITALLLVAAMAVTLGGVSVLAADSEEETSTTTVEENQSKQEEASAAQETEEADAGQPAVQEDAEEQSTAPEDTEEPEESVAPEVVVVPDAVGSVSFANLGSRMRENNFNMLALSENIAAIQSLDYEKMTDDIRKQLNSIANSQWLLTISGNSFASTTLQTSYDSLRDIFDDLKDGELQDDNDAVIRQLENAQDQIVMAGESLYIALIEMGITDSSLNRQLTALDRTIEELSLRYDLGQITALTLQQTKAGRTALVSGQQTLGMNIANYKTQLEMLIGAEQTGNIQLQALPQVTDQQLDAMDLESDLASAKEASYSLFAAQRTLDDANDDWKDAVKKYSYNPSRYEYVQAQHTWQAAQHTYNATLQSYENSFRTLYNQVKDYKQVLDAAKVSLAVEQANYASQQLKYDQGTLAQNKLLDAADAVTEAQEKVDSAAIDLFSAYNNYRWAVNYGILN